MIILACVTFKHQHLSHTFYLLYRVLVIFELETVLKQSLWPLVYTIAAVSSFWGWGKYKELQMSSWGLNWVMYFKNSVQCLTYIGPLGSLNTVFLKSKLYTNYQRKYSLIEKAKYTHCIIKGYLLVGTSTVGRQFSMSLLFLKIMCLWSLTLHKLMNWWTKYPKHPWLMNE